MIPVPKDPTDETETGSAPSVKGGDRIGFGPVEDGSTSVIVPSSAAVDPSHAPAVAPPRVHEGHTMSPPQKPGENQSPPSPAPVVTSQSDLSSTAPEVTIHLLSTGPTVHSAGETPKMPMVRPATPAVDVDPIRDEPTIMIAPRAAAAPPPPPRAAMPPSLPPDAVPPPPPSTGPGRKPLIGKPIGGPGDRTPMAPQYYPMPSTIAPTEPVRKRSTFRSKAARSSVVVVFDGMMSLATVVAFVLWLAAFAGHQEFDMPGPLEASTVVIIPPKKTHEEIGELLENAGVVSSGTIFVYGSMIAQDSDMKAGEYEFRPHETMHEVADEIQQNKVVQHKITFPEGWTSEQIVQRLIDDPVLAGKVVAIPEEGSLLPDTYTFPRGETRQQILDRMHKGLDRRLTDIWAHRNADALRQLKVPKDLVILASIVEKETAKPDERARIAGVFVNRLNRNMRLETDPTILYGLYGGKAWTEPRTITRADLAAPNPYNTYKINGLPPGPIGNPGRAALEAAANPTESNELYFVADGTGGHAFAETLDEHNKNVAKWREIERQRKAADPTNAQAPSTPGAGTGVLAVPAIVAPQPTSSATTKQPALPKPTTTQRRVKVPGTSDQPLPDNN